MIKLSDLFGSKSRAEIFRILFSKPGQEFYLREIHRSSRMSIRPIQVELSRLMGLGLIRSRIDGNRVYYFANISHPFFSDIKSLVEKTSGFQAVLKAALIDSQIKLAFVFGSIASGKAKPESDIDLFIIGNIGLRTVTQMLAGVSEQLGREVNPQVMSEIEFRNKIEKRAHFVTALLDVQKLYIVGNEDDFKRLGKK
jgi:predicted nucleotidyltransferase